ncbi:MAG: NAD(P)/FAD-dependent oxidoreductase [Flavobacteriales bacterium]
MLPFSKLSFWERSIYTDGIDFTIIGAGIVGMCTALQLRKVHPTAKIILLERGYLPTGASTKNAGFTCFGSPTEIYDDLTHIDEKTVWDTVEMRLNGLQELFHLVDAELIDYHPCGSWDLVQEKDKGLPASFLDYLNEKISAITGEKNVYQLDSAKVKAAGFEGFQTAYYNRLEGAIHTGKLILQLHQSCVNKGIHTLFGINVEQYEPHTDSVQLQTNMGDLNTVNLLICTNAFAKDMLPDISPARAQVLITKPIPALLIDGTFHLESGYYYFRNVGQRLLLGGGRNLVFQGETTTEFETSEVIQQRLLSLLQEQILPRTPFEIDYAWSGIMAVGSEKKPIIQKTNKNVAFGVRMGGMGVAIGASVGKELSKLFL